MFIYFIIFLIPLDTGLHNLFSIFFFCSFNKFFTFLYLTWYMYFLEASNFYALVVFVLFTFSFSFLPFLFFSTVACIILLFVFFSRIFFASCLNTCSISSNSINCCLQCMSRLQDHETFLDLIILMGFLNYLPTIYCLECIYLSIYG